MENSVDRVPPPSILNSNQLKGLQRDNKVIKAEKLDQKIHYMVPEEVNQGIKCLRIYILQKHGHFIHGPD